MVNRGVVIVRPKQPYLDWARSLGDSGVMPDVKGERTIYLIPDFESDEQAWEILEEIYDEIFDNELWGWHTDPSAWPQDRSFPVFQQWFHVESHSVVEDLCRYDIVDENDK
ncbi:MAG: hypothetical protein ACE5NJ_06890 [Thermodesulfobacteriota bacterium]